MSDRPPPAQIPTLTEVVARPQTTRLSAVPAPAPAPISAPTPPSPAPVAAPSMAMPNPIAAPPMAMPPASAAPAPALAAVRPVPPATAASPVATTATVPGPGRPSEGELVDRVLAHLQKQVDLALEVKLRESLTPILTRAADTIVREARRELTSNLRDLVSRAIAQELARRGHP